MSEGTCKTCGAKIRWAKTSNGKSMPLDYEPHERGNLILDDGGHCGPIAKGIRPRPWPRYLSHFATCKDAAQHRHDK